MTVGSLFSGIGGLDLGFERAGFTIKWMCEKDEYARRVLRKHWAEVPLYDDIEELKNPPYVDVITGGFPCQDISLAGKGAGLDGDRSRLWWEMHRIISEVRPRYAVMENVAALVNRGLGAVLGSLSEIGYDAEWTIVSAASVGAPHVRERLFIVAYAGCSGLHERRQPSNASREGGKPGRMVRDGLPEGRDSKGEAMADSGGNGLQGIRRDGATPRSLGLRSGARRDQEQRVRRTGGYWLSEPDVGRVANGIPSRVDRLRGLGNAVVPAVAEYVARCVMEHANTTSKNTPKSTKFLE